MIDITVDGHVNTSNPNTKVNYRAVFTGEALFTIEAVNPSKDDIVRIKGLQNIADRIHEPQYTNITLKSEDYTKIEFLLSFDPNEFAEGDNNYPEKCFVSYPVFVRDALATNKDGNKIQLIDQHNQTVWVPYRGNATAADLLKEYIAVYSASQASENYLSYLNGIDTDTVRLALKGEANLYQFLFNMTVLPRHGSNIKNDEGQEESYILESFVLEGNAAPDAATAAFRKLTQGDVSYIRKVMASPICKYKDGKIARIGGLLGVRVNDSNPHNVKFYQEIFTSPIEVCTFKERGRPIVRNKGAGDDHLTRLSNSAYNSLVSERYPWRNEWEGFEFTEYTTDSYKSPKTAEAQSPDFPGDDLPF